MIPHILQFLIYVDAFFSICRCIGDHRGDKQKFYPADCVRLLTRHEIDYIIALVSQSSSCGIDTSRIGSLKPLWQYSFYN